MPLYHAIGPAVVSDEELLTRLKSSDEGLRSMSAELAEMGGSAARRKPAGREGRNVSVTLGGREITAERVVRDLARAGTLAFKSEIGVGKPLGVIIRHVYTGRYPKAGVFSANRDVLVTSAVRDVFTTVKGAPRAVNIIKKRVKAGSDVGLDATDDGTPLVFYSPAVTMVSTTVTIEMAFDDFPEELVSRIGGAIQGAGGIPIFGPFGPVLIGVGMAIKLISTLANALVDARPEFKVSERLDFQLPDAAGLAAGYKILCEPTFDASGYSFELDKGLVDADGKVYAGPEPYVVLLVDGTEQERFKDFAPTAATAAMLERFLQQKEGSEVLIDAIVSGVKLVNDLALRKDADRLGEKLKTLNAGSDEHTATKAKLDAVIANIGEALLKPKG